MKILARSVDGTVLVISADKTETAVDRCRIAEEK
jgi:hypothetical protein